MSRHARCWVRYPDRRPNPQTWKRSSGIRIYSETLSITKQYPWDISHRGTDGTSDTIRTRFAGFEIANLGCAGTSTRTIAKAPAFTEEHKEWPELSFELRHTWDLRIPSRPKHSRWSAMEENPIAAAAVKKQAFEDHSSTVPCLYTVMQRKSPHRREHRSWIVTRIATLRMTTSQYEGEILKREVKDLNGGANRKDWSMETLNWEVDTSWECFTRHSDGWIRVVGRSNEKLIAYWILRWYTRYHFELESESYVLPMGHVTIWLVLRAVHVYSKCRRVMIPSCVLTTQNEN